MNYKATKTISLIMVIILLVGSLSGCFQFGDPNVESSTPTVNNDSNVPNNDTDETENKVIEITPEEEEKIKEIYANNYGFDPQKMSLDFKAEFNGAYAIVVNSGQNIIGSELFSIYYIGLTEMSFLEYYETINGLDFVYAEEEPIHIIYNDVCYRLPQAYEMGIIDEEELYILYTKNKTNNKHRFEDEQYFVNFEVIVYPRPSYYEKEYSIDDFSSVGCVMLEEKKYGERARCLYLTLNEKTIENVWRAIDVLIKKDEFYSVVPHYNSFRPLATIPNDTFLTFSDEWAIDKISLPEAWDITTGSSSVKVGILDSGIDSSHPDLINRVNSDISYAASPTWDAYVSDHGTIVASIIGAEGDNGIYISGVCWDVTLVSFNIHNSDGSFNMDSIINAISYANNNGIRVLNLSFGGYTSINNVADLKEAIAGYNGLVICACGNDYNDNDTNPLYPASLNLDNIISVGASNIYENLWTSLTTNENGTIISAGSNYGKTSVDLFAPGAAVYFCYPTTYCDSGEHDIENTVHKDIGLHIGWGTSFAAPYVAGVAALLLSEYPDMELDEIKCRIMRNVDDCGTTYDNQCASGGRLNAYATLADTRQGHWFENLHGNSNGGHISVCRYCKYVCDSIGERSYVNTGSATVHRIVCDTCGYSYQRDHTFYYTNYDQENHLYACQDCGYIALTEAHSFECETIDGNHGTYCTDCEQKMLNTVTYTGDSVFSGHTATCSQCNYSATEPHDWLNFKGTYTCLKCRITSAFIPVTGISPELLAVIQSKGLTGDFAMAIDEETMLCRVGEDYYYVKADSEAKALALLNAELAVIKPEVQTE